MSSTAPPPRPPPPTSPLKQATLSTKQPPPGHACRPFSAEFTSDSHQQTQPIAKPRERGRSQTFSGPAHQKRSTSSESANNQSQLTSRPPIKPRLSTSSSRSTSPAPLNTVNEKDGGGGGGGGGGEEGRGRGRDRGERIPPSRPPPPPAARARSLPRGMVGVKSWEQANGDTGGHHDNRTGNKSRKTQSKSSEFIHKTGVLKSPVRLHSVPNGDLEEDNPPSSSSPHTTNGMTTVSSSSSQQRATPHSNTTSDNGLARREVEVADREKQNDIIKDSIDGRVTSNPPPPPSSSSPSWSVPSSEATPTGGGSASQPVIPPRPYLPPRPFAPPSSGVSPPHSTRSPSHSSGSPSRSPHRKRMNKTHHGDPRYKPSKLIQDPKPTISSHDVLQSTNHQTATESHDRVSTDHLTSHDPTRTAVGNNGRNDVATTDTATNSTGKVGEEGGGGGGAGIGVGGGGGGGGGATSDGGQGEESQQPGQQVSSSQDESSAAPSSCKQSPRQGLKGKRLFRSVRKGLSKMRPKTGRSTSMPHSAPRPRQLQQTRSTPDVLAEEEEGEMEEQDDKYPDPLPQGIVDPMVILCVAYLNRETVLKEAGLFRIPGDVSVVKKLRSDYIRGVPVDLMQILDPHTIAGLLKYHFREWRVSIIPRGKPLEIVTAAVKDRDEEGVRRVLQSLPKDSLATLRLVAELLSKVVEYSEWNMMTSGTLATSCGQSFFPYLPPSPANTLLKFMVDHCNTLFIE